MKRLVYLDVCCLNRPFDDQTQTRIYLEPEAVLTILNNCQNGEWLLFGSETVDFEVSMIPDQERRKKVTALAVLAQEKIKINDEIRLRATELMTSGFKACDALHLACAENSNVDVFLTTDDRLLRKAIKKARLLKTRVENPVIWLMEVTISGHSQNES